MRRPPSVALGGLEDGPVEDEGADEAQGAHAQVDAPHREGHVRQVQHDGQAAHEVQRVHHEAQRVQEDVERHAATAQE